MPIRVTEPKVTERLPTAQLYLDDIQHIVNIFTDAESKATRTNSKRDETPDLTLQVGDRIADQIDDLPKITKRTRNLTIKIDRLSFALWLQVDDGAFKWWSYGLTTAQQWQIFHQLEAILRPKHTRLILARAATYALGIISTTLLFAAARVTFLAHIATSAGGPSLSD